MSLSTRVAVNFFYLQLRNGTLKTSNPVFQEEIPRSDTKARNDEGKRYMPVARFGHHLLSFWIDYFDSLGPLWIIRFGLSSLSRSGVSLSKVQHGNEKVQTFPIGCKR